jgi:N4-(beta-N-acetylglucosaminyl)-L-asparaginase
MQPPPSASSALDRRTVLAATAAALVGCKGAADASAPAARAVSASTGRRSGPVLVGSANALPGMQKIWSAFQSGLAPLDAAIEVVKVVEADPNDHSVGLGGLPNEVGVVQLDAACMHGPTHNSGAVACIENILHPSEVARLVLERTDHCLLVGPGAYAFARAHGHPHTELLTDAAREIWLAWKEGHSRDDDWLGPEEIWPEKRAPGGTRASAQAWWQRLPIAKVDLDASSGRARVWGTIHCSALSTQGELACCTTTSGLSFKIPGRVGDSPIVGAGLYCDQDCGSAGATGRGEANILANGSFAIVELLRRGAKPLEAALEVLRRVELQAQRGSRWQPGLLGADGKPAFNLQYYVLGLDGSFAGASLKPGGKYAVADAERGPHLEELVALH